MDHIEASALIDAYVDGEVDAAKKETIEEHVRTCEQCRGAERRLRDLRTAVKTSDPAYRASPRLRKNIRAAIRQETKTETEGWNCLRWPVMATALALVLLGFVLFQNVRSSRNAIVNDVIAAHVRSLLAAHLVDVPSSDQHTVKP